MYEPPGLYRRTEAERRDLELSWKRPDKAFFAAGACHILAFEFMRREVAHGFAVTGLHRPGAPYFDHVFASDGVTAFDFCGWTRADELMAETIRFESAITPDVELRLVAIADDLEQLCRQFRHRPPRDFLEDPRPRANRFLDELLAPMAAPVRAVGVPQEGGRSSGGVPAPSDPG